jgi:hypothetical protein
MSKALTDLKYGPQTTEIEAFIERLKMATPEQIDALSNAYDNAARSDEAREAWHTARSAELHAERALMREAAWRVAWDSSGIGDRNISWYSAWYATWYPILALVVRDLIATTDFDLLYGPWASVMDAE